jgi:diadenosine tetraphosphate (Ap4A) HIT family hydrolase
VGEHFTANAFQGESVRPRYVLQIRRHVTTYGDLTATERQELGGALSALCAAVEQEPGVDRVYVLSFNETGPGHLHWHVVPRFSAETGPYGPSLPDLEQRPADVDDERALETLLALTVEPTDETVSAAGATAVPAAASEPSAASAAAPRPRPPRPVLDSPLTDAVRSGLEMWNKHLSAYRLFHRFAGPHGDAGERYVLANLAVQVVLLGLVCLVPLPWWLTAPVCAIAVYRGVDVVVYALTIVLMTRRSTLRSVARSMVLFTLNLAELALIAAIVLVGLDGHAAAALWALGVAEPAGTGVWPAIVLRAQALASFTVLSLALATILSKISDSFDDGAAGAEDWIRAV